MKKLLYTIIMDKLDEELISKCEYLGNVYLYSRRDAYGNRVDYGFSKLFVRKLFDKLFYYVVYLDLVLPVFDMGSSPYIVHKDAYLYFDMPEIEL